MLTNLEGFCYAPGDEETVLETPIGNIGVAMCWEHIRYNTAKRMLGKVDLVLGGSCWWSFSESEINDLKIREKLNQRNHEIALNAPIDTNDYWIPDMPKPFLKYGWDMNEVFREYYKKVARPYILKEMICK